MKYIAIEEAFSIPGLALSQPEASGQFVVRKDFIDLWNSKLADFEEYRLPEMDAHGIDIQVLSLTVPGIQADTDLSVAADNARFANDYLAGVIDRYPDRFRGFAALPMQDPGAAVRELIRSVGQLGFVGGLVNDHTHGRYLDDPAYEEFWATLADLKVPLYVHPGSIPADNWSVLEHHPELYGATWSWQAEAGGHAMRILYSGVFDRHPEARLILGHLGEFLPFQRSRMDSRYRTLQLQKPLQRMPSEYFGTNILITTSGVLAPEAIEAAVLAIGAESVLFAIDYPYEETAQAVAALENSNLTDEVKNKISYSNASRILKL
ncbi:TIM-barrel fold metal-dependent hydrolase [Mycobacteroides abscessus subsp. abscessus]|uniref:amidohydrolase family protein n=1 Tax=Mycobacteroides abscessus TaxID=36809 RepID=UPI00092B1B61|nr:amidohydrolase family protein [Mycobacteroides abscessus]SHT51295.1 TIM-barrel fold metal-dependent hydrolase [Mycobacteroides abscessus subsp. abscessus]SHT55518.1 TIM-barrel fold metal-dependent hydrolase [Mycobacteroides abscessus subsp. abscessus]SHT57876.1 TIM-barrel fold metal-dependent hydrolase [Mycobacteroides abscessus subsp. abscessus]SHX51545.1 TIM-barrel fold metal-dependent hydrolase [Mycobacteroides abscessus subsp. abscessus]SIB59309.1 TIM-barrel fold metal-dependent hydrola